MVQLSFNAQQVQPNVALEPVPSGDYVVAITASEEKPTKNGQGSYIEFEMTIQAGPFTGRKLFDRLNIRNANAQTVEIAYRTLSAICHVTGRLSIVDTAQLHGVPFTAVAVKKKRDDDPTRETNEVRGYKDVNGKDPGFAGTVSQPQAQPGWAQTTPTLAPQPTPQPAVQATAPSYAPPATATVPDPNVGQAPPPWAGQAAGPTAPPPWVGNQ